MENNEYEKTILSFLQMSVVKKKIRPRSGLRKYYNYVVCLLYTSPSPRDRQKSRMPSSA